MGKPENCSSLMYDVMLQCWNEDPVERPMFKQLRENMEAMISHDDHYIDFDIKADHDYYNVASFRSVESDRDDDVFEEEFLSRPVQVRSTQQCKEMDFDHNDVDGDGEAGARYATPQAMKDAHMLSSPGNAEMGVVNGGMIED